jgi:hypothetical protein
MANYRGINLLDVCGKVYIVVLCQCIHCRVVPMHTGRCGSNFRRVANGLSLGLHPWSVPELVTFSLFSL